MGELTRGGEAIRYTVAVVAVVLSLWDSGVPPESLAKEIGLAVVALVAMHWRRKHPMLLTVILALLTPFSLSMQTLVPWAYVSLATHRNMKHTIACGVLLSFTWAAAAAKYQDPDLDLGRVSLIEFVLVDVTASAVIVAVLAVVGGYFGLSKSQRVAMQAKLEANERERDLIERESRAQERTRIAREMHDVLAHKITLIKMHAGVLSYRTDLSPEEVAVASKTIEESAEQALTELRVILGQLRQSDEVGVAAPQPTLTDLDALIDEHRRVGRSVELEEEIEGEPSATVSRQAYRILQEALTNAAKHALGTPVSVAVRGNSADGLTLVVRNPLSLAAKRAQGARLGLIGLDERARAVGGTFKAGPNDHGEFVVEVWLPW